MTPTATLKSKPDLDAARLHALEREYGDLSAYDMPVPLPPGTHAAFAKAILAVAGADGKVSTAERNFLLGRAMMLGSSQEELEEIARFDPKGADLNDVLAPIPPSSYRQVLHDAILVARVDGFGPKERAAAVRMAQKLGLSAEFVNALEAQFAVEEGVRQARIRLVQGPK